MVTSLTERVVYHSLTKLPSGEALPSYGIHKLLYRLSREHPALFAEALPYYWYEHGPISEPVISALDSLANSRAFLVAPSFGGVQYQVGPGPAPAPLSPQEDDALTATIRRFGATPSAKLRDDIYRDEAPYPFMPLLKVQVWPLLEALADDLSAGRENLSRRGRQAVAEAPGLIAQSERRLPLDVFFDEFVEAFSLYRTTMERLLDQATRHPGPDAAAKATLAFAKTKQVWTVFAHGVRVRQHDAYYEPRVDRWTQQYRNEVANLLQELDRFYDTVARASLPDPIEPSWSPVDRAILTAIFQKDPPDRIDL